MTQAGSKPEEAAAGISELEPSAHLGVQPAGLWSLARGVYGV